MKKSIYVIKNKINNKVYVGQAIKHINAGRNYKNSALSYPLKTGRAKGEKEPVSTILAKRSTLTIDT